MFVSFEICVCNSSRLGEVSHQRDRDSDKVSMVVFLGLLREDEKAFLVFLTSCRSFFWVFLQKCWELLVYDISWIMV